MLCQRSPAHNGWAWPSLVGLHCMPLPDGPHLHLPPSPPLFLNLGVGWLATATRALLFLRHHHSLLDQVVWRESLPSAQDENVFGTRRRHPTPPTLHHHHHLHHHHQSQHRRNISTHPDFSGEGLQCIFTSDHAALPRAQGVIFHARDLELGRLPPRTPSALWIYHSEENPLFDHRSCGWYYRIKWWERQCDKVSSTHPALASALLSAVSCRQGVAPGGHALPVQPPHGLPA